jgi:hypothetical protein
MLSPAHHAQPRQFSRNSPRQATQQECLNDEQLLAQPSNLSGRCYLFSHGGYVENARGTADNAVLVRNSVRLMLLVAKVMWPLMSTKTRAWFEGVSNWGEGFTAKKGGWDKCLEDPEKAVGQGSCGSRQ